MPASIAHATTDSGNVPVMMQTESSPHSGGVIVGTSSIENSRMQNQPSAFLSQASASGVDSRLEGRRHSKGSTGRGGAGVGSVGAERVGVLK